MRTTVICALAALAVAAPVRAHHSIAAEFDMNRPVTFSGTVTKIEWTNPHIYTHVEVKEPDGKVVEYRVEGGPPNALYRAGWRKDTLKVGAKAADGKRVFATGGGGGAAAAPQQQ